MTNLLQDNVYISTRPLNQNALLEELLTTEGAKLLKMPTIEIQPVIWDEKKLEIILDADHYDWLVFTSVNGVQYFFEKLKSLKDEVELTSHIKIAAIGEQTALKLYEYGYQATFVNPSNSSEELAKVLINEVLPTDKVLLVLGNLARGTMAEILSQKVQCTRLDVYETVLPAHVDEKHIKTIIDDKYDLIVLTSPSAFVNLLAILDGKVEPSKLKLASIGKTTTAEIEKYHLKPIITASMSNAEGIFKAIIEATY
jgi:uroporphyrinogen-III synthase